MEFFAFVLPIALAIVGLAISWWIIKSAVLAALRQHHAEVQQPQQHGNRQQ